MRGENADMSHVPFEIIPGDLASPVVMHVPHAATWIEPSVRADILLSDAELAAELAAITDAITDVVAERAAAAASMRPWILVNRTSRLVVDPERFPDEREELNKVGMGAVYERTTTGAVLRRPTPAERQALIDDYFTPYAEGIAQLVRDRLAEVGTVTILDVHSYPQVPNPYELHVDQRRPEVCVGTDELHTPTELREQTLAAMRAAAPTGDVGLDAPFWGCYVPLDQYGTNPAVRAVMVEIRRDVVANHLDPLVEGVAALVTRISELGRATDAGAFGLAGSPEHCSLG